MLNVLFTQREGSCMMEDDPVDIENENGNRFEEYEWCGQKRIRATTLLEGGFRGKFPFLVLKAKLLWGSFLILLNVVLLINKVLQAVKCICFQCTLKLAFLLV